ncbi:hypothetical protein [Streptomyces sp. NPDC006012]|uniref:hypothetical protein n=1 Tax=Streptomyces sp. NPDC006012 TaxID=3364739 RepID=UPI0036CB00E2
MAVRDRDRWRGAVAGIVDRVRWTRPSAGHRARRDETRRIKAAAVTVTGIAFP